ncbi:hypothetical protein CR513_25654, partial [Mucuna pruriens]
MGQQLYRKGFSFPLLRCMDEEEFEYVIYEVHEDVYRTHKGGRALASKSARVGTARVVSLYHITLAIYKWGVDTVGPFPTAPGQIKYLIVVVDYFTKWVEAEPIATISRTIPTDHPLSAKSKRRGVEGEPRSVVRGS